MKLPDHTPTVDASRVIPGRTAQVPCTTCLRTVQLGGDGSPRRHVSTPAATMARREAERARPCYCLALHSDHVAGAAGCEYNADWTAR